MEDLSIDDLRGGLNDTDAPHALTDNECVLAENVEFFFSMLGERRNGCEPLDITGAGLGGQAAIVHLSQWFPTNVMTAPELWAIGATASTSVAVARRSGLTWSAVTPVDAILTTAPNIYHIVSQELNGKFFFAYPSSVNRLHVWDGTTLRPTGLTAPVAPTGANEGAGTYAGTRYFRTREIIKSGTTIVARSEPSPVLTFAPSGAGAGTTVTKPATINASSTHWELEASTDNVNFYLIATTLIATTTVNDEVVFATGYAASGALSDAIGAYLLQTSARFLAVDGDRLLLGGHWTDTTLQSTVSWSPVFNDPGKGNDERAPIVATGGTNINNSTSLDNYAGGPLTGISGGVNGSWYAFKWSRIYKMVRTGDVVRAYDPLVISTTRGAIPGSIFTGIDENGAACVYFLDPMMGPSRIGPSGLQVITGLRLTWGRVNNRAANIVACGAYYKYKQQAKWWVAVDGNDTPNLELVLQVSETRSMDAVAASGGWATATGRIAEAYCVANFTELLVNDDGFATLFERPFIGLTSPDFIQRCDAASTDAGEAYVATVRSHPYFVTGLLNRWGAMVGALLADAQAGQVTVRLIRDMGVETTPSMSVDLAPEGTETMVIKDLDDLSLSEARCIQVEFSDS